MKNIMHCRGIGVLVGRKVLHTGPRYSKLGSRLVVYDERDLDEFLDARKRKSTSEEVQ